MKRVLCYGDSNTYGANPNWTPDSDMEHRWPETVRWPKVLQSLLGTEEYEIIEEGLNGRTTIYRDQAWPYCEGRGYLTPCVISHNPIDMIIVMLGTNDLKVINCPGPDSIGLAMSEFMKVVMNPFLYEGRPMPKVLLVSPILIGDNLKNSFMYGTFTDTSYEIGKKMPEIYETIAKQFGCEFMRASDYAKASEIDSIHMDAENHGKLAVAMRDKILEIFGE